MTYFYVSVHIYHSGKPTCICIFDTSENTFDNLYFTKQTLVDKKKQTKKTTI